MKQKLTFTFIFKKLQLTLNNEIGFNLELKSMDKNVSLLNQMKISNQYEQYIEVKCIVKKVNLKYEEKIRKINIVLSDGKSKKCAGFVIFDISVPLNLGMKQKEYSLFLMQCPDQKAYLDFTILINSLDQTSQNTDVDSMTSKSLSQYENEEMKKLRLENANLKNGLEKIKQDLNIVQKQYEFLGQQHKQLQIQYEEKTNENNELQEKVEQLYKLNSLCIEQIKNFEKQLKNQKQVQEKANSKNNDQMQFCN